MFRTLLNLEKIIVQIDFEILELQDKIVLKRGNPFDMPLFFGIIIFKYILMNSLSSHKKIKFRI